MIYGLIGVDFISVIIGTKLLGTIYLSQNLRFYALVKIGDKIKARVEIVSINQEKGKIELKIICTNQERIIIIDDEVKI
jgi:3-hydroxybutyryl-coA dehydratase